MSVPARAPALPRRLIIIGTGCIAQGLLPLLFRHIELPRSRVCLLGPDPCGALLAQRHGVAFVGCLLTADNYACVLGGLVEPGDFVVNLALGVGSLELLDWCQSHDVLYLDTNLEPWAGADHPVHEARASALGMRRRAKRTAVIAHGANPGLTSHFVKQALSELAATRLGANAPASNRDWAALAQALGVRTLIVTEYDSQTAPHTGGRQDFSNTWSARGLCGELQQPAELYWGAHEPCPPPRALGTACHPGRAVVIPRPAGTIAVRSWTPEHGPMIGYMLAHHDSLSIGSLLTPEHGMGGPTVFYAYRPCPAALRSTAALRAQGWTPSRDMRLLRDELDAGANELGILVLGEDFGYWFGSRLTLEAARRLAPDNNATSLQVVAGVLGGLVWALENPAAGVVEAEDMDHRRILEVATPWLGTLGGKTSDWRPAEGRLEAGLSFAAFLAPSPPDAAA